MQLKVNKPETVYIKFTEEIPHYFSLSKGSEVYYFRYLDGKTPRIKFNMLERGDYFGNVPFEVVKTTEIELPYKLPKLPKPDRNRQKEVKVVIDSNMTGNTPIIFTHTGVIRCPPGFMQLPPPVRRFLLLHEVGHLFYSKEQDCDLFAFVNYMREGNNRSIAMYSLTQVLGRSQENLMRIYNMYNNIQYTQKNKL